MLLLNTHPSHIDQMLVIDAGRTGRHARQASQAAIDMLCHDNISHIVVFQHVLDEVDAATWRIILVAQNRIGRASGGAEPTMYAVAQNLVGRGDVRIRKLRQGKMCLHRFYSSECSRPRLKSSFGSKAFLMPRSNSSGMSAGKTSSPLRQASGARSNVACPPSISAARIEWAKILLLSLSTGMVIQIRPPPQSREYRISGTVLSRRPMTAAPVTGGTESSQMT